MKIHKQRKRKRTQPDAQREAFRTQMIDQLSYRLLLENPGGADGQAMVALDVADSGVGMSPEVMAHLFEPFYTTKPEGRGTGLGLATVYGIVEESGGGIIVESKPKQGASFTIYFPALPALG